MWTRCKQDDVDVGKKGGCSLRDAKLFSSDLTIAIENNDREGGII